MPTLSALPADGLLRLKQILGDERADPPVPALIPIAHSTWWEGIAAGRYPQPIKLGPRMVAWRIRDIRPLLEHGVAAGAVTKPSEAA